MTVGATSSPSLSSTYLNNLGADSNAFSYYVLVMLVFLTIYKQGETTSISWFPL